MTWRLLLHLAAALIVIGFAGPASAVVKPSPACNSSETGHPITEMDDVRWPDAPGVVRIEVLGNDYDLEGDPLRVSQVTPIPGTNGSVALSTDQQAVIFTPGTRPDANISFNYTASDGVHSTPGTVRLLVNEPAPPPGTPVPDFTVKCDFLRCYFKGEPNGITEIRAYRWQFLEHPPCSREEWRSATMTCFLPQAGIYHVGLTVVRFNGEQISTPTLRPVEVKLDPAQVRWLVLNAPAANAAATPGLKATYFIEYTNRDECADQCIHSFDFGDETPVQQAARNPTTLGWQGGSTSHVYTSPGVYRVRLIVGGGTTPEVFEKFIDVRNKTPEIGAFFVDSPTPQGTIYVAGDPADELDVIYPDTPHPNGARYVDLDLGDGTETTVDTGWWSDAFRYYHTYEKPGKYTIVARLADGFGAVGTATAQVQVDNVAPRPEFVFDCDPVTRRCTFDGRTSRDPGGAIASWNWTLRRPNGEYVVLRPDPQVERVMEAGANDWTMTLTVTDDAGTTGSVTRDIRFPAVSGAPLDFFTVTQKRLLDTRQQSVRVSGEAPVTVDLQACCGISLPGLAAAAINVTVVDPAQPGTLQLSAGTSTQSAGPLMAFDTANVPIAGNAVVPVQDGKFTVSMAGGSGSAHVVVDLTGVFAPSNPSADAMGPNRFRAVEPCRVLDSRLTPPGVAAGADRGLVLRRNCGIGSDAVAVTVGLASFNFVSGSNTNMSAFPSDRADANTTSIVNLKPGYIRANGLFLALATGAAADDVKLRIATGSTDVAFDVSGYFAPATAGGLRYVPVSPCLAGSVLLAQGHEKTFKIAGNCGVPRGVVAAVITHRLRASYFTGHLILYSADREPPVASNSNYASYATGGTANNQPVATSVVKLAPGADGDLAAVANFTGGVPDGIGWPKGVTVDAWVWGYFVADEAQQ